MGFVIVSRVDPTIFEILCLATHPNFSGQGIMFEALGALILTWQQDGIQQVWLEVHEHNQAALGLYRRLGFVENARRQKYYQDGGAGLLMTLTISP